MSESSQDLSNKTNDNSVVNDEVSVAQSSAFPGRILRAAREELNYSLEQVAQELHLRPSVVLAMEDEKYDDFSSDVFLKGYFRSYCRLVNLHEERMVDLLEAQLKGLQKDIDDAAHVIKKEKQVQKQKKVFIGLLLVALIVGVFSFLISLFYPIDGKAVQVESLSKPNNSIVDSLPKKVDDTDNPSLKTENPSSEVDTNLSVGTELDDKAVQSDTVEKIAYSKPETKKTLTTAEIVKQKKDIVVDTFVDSDAELLAKHQATNLSVFKATFTGDCWFKLVDGNKKTVFASLKRNGDRISYSGVTPFNIVLGDASKADLSFEGNKINLKSHTANNGRAQLTLNKG